MSGMVWTQVGEERGLRVRRMCGARLLRPDLRRPVRRASKGVVLFEVVGVFWGTSPVYGFTTEATP